MRKLTLIFLVFFTVLAMHCVKKQFVPFEKPYSVMHIKANSKVEILQEPLKKEMIVWDSEKLAEIPVEGLLRVTYKSVDYFYLQMNCPQQLKCNGQKVYIPRNLTHAQQPDSVPFKNEFKEPENQGTIARFVLAESSQVKSLIELRDWMIATEKKHIPSLFDRGIFDANLPETNQTSYIGNLIFFARSVSSGEFSDKVSPQFLAQFPIYSELSKRGANTLPRQQSEFIYSLKSSIESTYSALLRQEIDAFPFANASYTMMANAFNKISNPQLLKAELAGRIIEGVPYIVKIPALPAAVAPGGTALTAAEGEAALPAPTPVKVTAQSSLKAGAIFEYELDGKKVQLPTAESDFVAFAHEKGLGFQLGKDKDLAIILEPAEESPFLKSGNKAEIQKFIKAIPDFKDIVKDNELDQALIRIAMKYGKGELNRRTALFEYEIDLKAGRNFWIVLAAIKHYFGVDSETKYGGKIPQNRTPYGESSEDSKGAINWYQKFDGTSKLASMGITGKASYCQRNCIELEIDSTCMTNENKLKVVFRPAAILEKEPLKENYYGRSPAVRADFNQEKPQGTTDDYRQSSCNEFFRIARTDVKFE